LQRRNLDDGGDERWVMGDKERRRGVLENGDKRIPRRKIVRGRLADPSLCCPYYEGRMAKKLF